MSGKISINKGIFNKNNAKLILEYDGTPLFDEILGFNIPGLNIGLTSIPAGGGLLLNLPGDNITFSELTISFVVDYDMENWWNFYEWILVHSNPFTHEAKPVLNNVTGRILRDTGKCVSQFEIKYLFPTSLTDIDTVTTEVNTFDMASVTFSHNGLVRVPK